ncbi:hypothetical protein IEO21_08680 [Rhodonia placenta]|uniref:Uncharacterized protein n=1 Tax=Rhodonia placenta TaxID=104341 RepID=A0A8H7NW73_9APHY|nr:hypothetical protein IEO21_08680 [Postia placenta]
MDAVSLLSADLAAICIESLFYGIFLVLSIASLYVLTRRGRETSDPRIGGTTLWSMITPMSLAAVSLFMTNMAHWIINVYRIFQAFVILDDETERIQFLGDLPQPSDVCKLSVLMASLIIGDMMLVYRLWVVWAYNKVVTFPPLCSLLGLIVCAIGALYEISRAYDGESLFASAPGDWITANCVFTLCTNVYSTGFIAWRIWRANKEARRFGGVNLMGVLGILVESAALYTAWTILFFVTFLLQSNLAFFFSDTYSAIAGIAFMLINVRVGMGWAPRATIRSALSASIGPFSPGANGPYSMGRLTVNVTKVIHRDDGIDPPIKFASNSDLELPGPRVQGSAA